MTFQWKQGSRHTADPQKTGELLEALENDGGLTAGRLVNVSRPEGALLHNEFEWNDETAAELYREDQARHIIRCIVVTPEKDKPHEYVRAFFNVKAEEKHEYHSIVTVSKDLSLQERLLSSAIKDMRCFAEKYRNLKELLPVLNAIDSFCGTNEVVET